MPAKNIVQSSQPCQSDAKHQTQLRPHKQDHPTGYVEISSPSNTPLFSITLSLLFCTWACALSQLAAEWMDAEVGMDGGREGGRSGEVNEIPMRCQGVLAVRCGE